MNKPSLFDLTGEIAVVTGGNGVIGRGIALGLAQAGASVAIVGRNPQKNQNVLAELKSSGAYASHGRKVGRAAEANQGGSKGGKLCILPSP